MSERGGFEPTIPVKVCPLSTPILSTTPPPPPPSARGGRVAVYPAPGTPRVCVVKARGVLESPFPRFLPSTPPALPIGAFPPSTARPAKTPAPPSTPSAEYQEANAQLPSDTG